MARPKPQTSHLMTKAKVATSLTQRALRLASGSGVSFVDLAEVLAELRPRVSGAEFSKVLQQGRISPRKAMYLMRIWNRLEQFAPSDKLEQIGWTKLLLISAPSVKDKMIASLLSNAEQLTARELEHQIKGTKLLEKERCMLFRFSATDYAQLSETLKKYGAVKKGRGLVGAEKALIALISTTIGKHQHL